MLIIDFYYFVNMCFDLGRISYCYNFFQYVVRDIMTSSAYGTERFGIIATKRF